MMQNIFAERLLSRGKEIALLFLLTCLMLVVTDASGDVPAEDAELPQLDDFTTDGCSSFPDGTGDDPVLWRPCCVVHDVAYWKGGSAKERHAADIELRDCVAGVGAAKTAALMLSGVRVGGSPWLPSSFRWGYGWPFPRGYQEIQLDEQALVDARLAAARELLIRERVDPEAGPERQPGDWSIQSN